MAAPITVLLGNPVTVDGVRYGALHIRPMKRRNLKALSPGFDGEVGIAIAAHLASVPVAVIHGLSEFDAERVGGVVSAMVDRVL
ncbi:hypothetical protein Q8W71_05445 [Methylobacterium sp. NEAU 140]|uniref:hypothetical protein n=1 Tax=Methylobacterium sp. NEAU 140 TaxID=3064945 RepID=UPI002734E938|nr:hypothetical protein [Methylobacterium sp. NEAU 140]MDP4022057.1 hypothetical protein [Methylobacterium sp. NEAU 140]